MGIFSILFFVLMSMLIIYNHKANNKTTLDMRKEQSKVSLRENAIKKALEQNFENKAKYDKKYKIESLCAQGGFKISYGEYKFCCLLCAILLPILSMLVLKNEYLAIVSIFLGLCIPSQIITFIKNRRMNTMEKQIGSFLKMVTERYANTKNLSKAIQDCADDFKGAEPFYSELRDAIIEINLGTPTSIALNNLGKRTGSKYLRRLGDYYDLSLKLGTNEARNTLLKQSYFQYEEDRKIKTELKMAISGPANEAYIMIGFIPCTVLYNIMTNKDYITFMTQTALGKIGTTVIFSVILGCLWIVNTKLATPID